MELRHLRYFVTVAEEMHFGRAAERLHITQSPLSNGIKDLEQQLAVQLFVRNSKHVQLSKAGELLLVKARETLAHAARTTELARAIGEGKVGRLEIGFTGSMFFRGLADILNEMSRVNPGISMKLRELSSRNQMELIRQRQLDAGFVNARWAPPDMRSVLIHQDRFVACLPAHHRLSTCSSIDLGMLRDESFALFYREDAPMYYDLMLSLCAEAGFHPNVDYEVTHHLSTLSLVGSRNCVSIMPASLGQPLLPNVVFVPLQGASEKHISHSQMVWLQDNDTPGLTALIDLTMQSAASTLA